MNMKRLAITLALAGCLAGCVAIPDPDAGQSPFVYPHAGFVAEIKTSAWAGREQMGVSNYDDYVYMASNLLLQMGQDIPPAEFAALQTDPFLTTANMPFVTFYTFDPAQRVAKYYQTQFDNFGWRKVREKLLVEACNGGGDWIRVYQKDNTLVHIHIMGPWKCDEQEQRAIAEGDFCVRSIMLEFIGLKPSDLLGPHYKNKTAPDPAK